MIITVFRSRIRQENADEYFALLTRMGDIARSMPGYISHKAFTAEDGERVSIIYFESEETHRAWAEHPEHRASQRVGREKFYSQYSIHICESRYSHEFKG